MGGSETRWEGGGMGKRESGSNGVLNRLSISQFNCPLLLLTHTSYGAAQVQGDPLQNRLFTKM